MWKSTGRKPKQLDTEPLPDALAHVWAWWLDVRGHDPLTWSELHAWSAMSATSVSGFEADAMMAIDRICRRIMNEC